MCDLAVSDTLRATVVAVLLVWQTFQEDTGGDVHPRACVLCGVGAAIGLDVMPGAVLSWPPFRRWKG